MNLWVDDIRTPPFDSYIWARSANEAITAIKSYERNFAGSDTIFISLDHDAGITPPHTAAIEGFLDERGTFYDRYEAYIVAMNNGQMSTTTRQHKCDKGEKELYSEDLY